MADQDVEDTGDGGEDKRKSGGMVRMLGLGFGLFLLMSLAQITTAIVAKSFFPGLMYAAAPAVTDEETDGAEAEAEEAEIDPRSLGPAIYAPMDQPLIVSFPDGSSMRFLQVSVEAMARDENSIAAFSTHRPAIRNNLLTLFSTFDLNELATIVGKEKARSAALREVQAILAKNAPEARIEDIYFTAFVVQ